MSHMNALLVGTVPFGFDLGTDGRTLVPNAGEAAIVAEVRAANAACESFSSIARGLNARRILTRRAGNGLTHKSGT
jgi:hypothetical protein